MNVDGSNVQIIHQFDDANGQVPIGQMIYGSDGRLYGACDKSGPGGLVDNRMIFGVNTDGSNYTILKTFTTAATDGRLVGELVEGTGGNLYGCTGHADFSADGSGGGFTVEPSIIFKISYRYYRNGLIKEAKDKSRFRNKAKYNYEYYK